MEDDVYHQLRTAPSSRRLGPVPRQALRLGILAAVLLAGAPAAALTAELPRSGSSVVGESYTFKVAVTEASGEVTFDWRIGDAPEYVRGGAELPFTFTSPGQFNVDVIATDATGESSSAFAQHLVHYPLTQNRPTSSTSIVYDATRKRVYSVNQDVDSVTSLDAEQLTKVAEVGVYRQPEALAIAPSGKLWVVHKDDYAVAVVNLDSFQVEGGFRLPYASQPVGLAMSPTGDAAYVTLMAVGKLLKLDPASGAVLGEVDVGPRPRGVAVSHDGREVYVTRFISPNAGGEVVKVTAPTLQVEKRILLRLDTETEDNPQRARGVPNYLFAVALTPDGRQAWIPGKKDNIVRGPLLDGQSLTHDSTVRPIVSVVDTLAADELYANRIDLDDRGPPMHVEFSPFGNLAILSLGGSNRIEVRDVNRPVDVFSAIPDVGAFPRASVLTPGGRLFVQASLSREVLVYDLSPQLNDFDKATPVQLARIPTVAVEKLAPDVLLGKKLFHDSSDRRMANEGYISCAVCHFEGGDDGRVYDFTNRGEGLRNTMALFGRTRAGQGRLNWAGTIDEIQDFEHQIRDMFGGTGFLTDEALNTGTRAQPLGDPKAGLSPELDALAAYVATLERVNPSPYRNPDGTLTPDAVAGAAVFQKLGCDFCHGGAEFTDSRLGQLHDVGTITAKSGTRAGAPLLGLDSPTLLGVWETPPYLHDGSAATLRDVLTTSNPTDLHGYVQSLQPQQLEQLLSYLQQIDGDQALRYLPFEPPPPPGAGGSGGTASGGQPSGGQLGSGGQPSAGAGQAAGGSPGGSSPFGSCALTSVDAGRASPVLPWFVTILGVGLLRRRRRPRHQAACCQGEERGPSA